MRVPDNTDIYKGELATFWFDEDGILYALSNDTPRTLEKQQENYAFLRKVIGNKKVCMLADTTSSSPQDEVTREYSRAEMPHFFKAMAVISSSLLGQVIADSFVVFKENTVPTKFFATEQEAKEWLKTYL